MTRITVTKDIHFLVNTSDVFLTLQITRAITLPGIYKPNTVTFVMRYNLVINLCLFQIKHHFECFKANRMTESSRCC